MNPTKHVVLLTSNIFGRGFDSRRLHQYLVYYQLVRGILRGFLPASLNLFEINSFC